MDERLDRRRVKVIDLVTADHDIEIVLTHPIQIRPERGNRPYVSVSGAMHNHGLGRHFRHTGKAADDTWIGARLALDRHRQKDGKCGPGPSPPESRPVTENGPGRKGEEVTLRV